MLESQFFIQRQKMLQIMVIIIKKRHRSRLTMNTDHSLIVRQLRKKKDYCWNFLMLLIIPDLLFFIIVNNNCTFT